ncbi:MAG: hypothetical protein R3D28_25495, partial [Geminicoccaceae bacterium]
SRHRTAASASPPPEPCRRPAMRGPLHRALGVVLALLGGCAAFDDGTWDEPRRPPLDIARDVVDPSASQVVGSWACHELDPYPDQAPVLTELRLDPDGRFAWQQRIVLDAAAPGPFERILVLAGNWHLDAAGLVRSAVTGTSRPADGSAPDGPAPSMESVLAALAKEAETVPTALLRVAADALVMQDEDAGAATLACERLAP